MPFPLIPLIVSAAPSLIKAGGQIAKQVKERDRASSRPGAPPASSPATSGRGTPRPWPTKPTLPAMDDEQRQSMEVIASVARAAELPGMLGRTRPALTLALWVNAWHESRLRPGAANPGTPGRPEDSVGLFQINRAVHTQYTREQLVDPVTNTRALLGLVQAEQARFDDLLARGGTVADLTGGVTLWAERPADTMTRARERARTVVSWFPETRGRGALTLT